MDVLLKDEDKAATGLAGDRRRQPSAYGKDIPTPSKPPRGEASGSIRVQKCFCEAIFLHDTAKLQGDGLHRIAAVDTGHIPGGALAAGHHHIFAGIACHQAGLIPCRGQIAQEVLHLLGLCIIALGFVGQMLEAALEKHRQGQFVGIGGDMGVLRIAERTWCVVHRSDDVAGERQRGIMTGSLRCEGRHVVVPFGPIDGFRR